MTTLERPYIEIVSGIGVLRCELNKADLRFIGEFTRDNVSRWTYSHTGLDWVGILPVEDVHAVCGDVDIPWATEEARLCWMKCRLKKARQVYDRRTIPRAVSYRSPAV
jgi:hypothetical protein